MTKALSTYTKGLMKKLAPYADPEYAVQMKAYLRDQFEFLGMTSPRRNVVFREFFSESGLPGPDSIESTIEELFELEEREYHYFAIELARKIRKQWTAESIDLFESMAVRRSWWDTVDYIKSACLKEYFLKFPDGRYEITDRWIRSGNIWLQRLSVIFQLGYKQRTDTRLLERNILRLNGSDEFFVQKAIGWALRDYARTDSEYVRRFVRKHELKPLSRREALKRLK
jgi:3-methyladenine DNA glycosylase AlkD